MIHLKDMIWDKTLIDEDKLAEISDELWGIGNLSEIKEQVSSELFILHIGMNMIGNWQGEGWWGVISEQPELVPFIPTVLDSFGLHDLKTAFENSIMIFPEYTVFSNGGRAYCDIINFLKNVRFKVSDERLNNIAPEKRAEMVNSIHERIDILEELTEPLWGCCAERGGWGQIFDYINNHI